MNSPKFLLQILLLCFFFHFSVSIDTITLNSPLRDDGAVIVSVGKVFALGFFSPGGGNSKNRYVGIWYNQVPEQTVVWVANRDYPIDDKSGILSINNQGKLVLFGKNRTDSPVWSTNVSVITAASENSAAQLLDSGNLVLFQDDTKRYQLWQSFDYPSNTFLPLMKLGLDRRTGLNRFVTSWISPDDPGTGNYSFKMDTTGFPQLILYKGSDILWQAGSWTGQRFTGVPEMTRNYVLNVTYVDNEDEVYFMNGVTVANTITRMVVNESGILQRFTWNAENGRWIPFWSDPNERFDFYNYCGPNSNCNPYPVNKFECDCLPGYDPKSPNEWFLRDGSGGCVEKRVGSMCRSGEGFVKVARVKVPDTSIARANMSLGLKQCEEMCLNNCSCMAYANVYDGGIGCLMWHGDLMDTRTYANDGQDLYVRVDAVELALNAKKKSTILDNKGILAILIVSGVVGLSMAVCIIYCLVRRKSKGVRLKRSSYSFRYKTSRFLQNDILNSNNAMDENKSTSEVSFFDFSTIVAATNNFSRENKLGEGGFGPVYKGVLLNGEEIAVKRLSKHSGQGVREFKNEITLIVKLQHRNLVRMLGCCIEEEEKMLIYEYLPNKSLDFFIFDKMRGLLLDWETRFEIICGIARGILYLHQDSRLRIIHRDLKASNVLLDVAMNPKISDFGMARIFGSNQVEGNTNRVVGTYGYMSPEYAMQGQFSTKSDVYSFGIILLEIVSGRKNSGHYPDTIDTILVGRIWNLWREGKAMEIVDSSLIECGTFSVDEVLKCIHIGLLCVQDCVTDRPAMSAVVFMLGNAGAIIPLPNRPVFVLINNGDDHNDRTGSSVNLVTVTAVQGR